VQHLGRCRKRREGRSTHGASGSGGGADSRAADCVVVPLTLPMRQPATARARLYRTHNFTYSQVHAQLIAVLAGEH
jgi:hypothetical protein